MLLLTLQEPVPSHSAVCECGCQHQGQSEEDRPSTFQGLLGEIHQQSAGAVGQGPENCVPPHAGQGIQHRRD